MADNDPELREITEDDRAEWQRLWTGYLTFYETSVSPEIYEITFARLLSRESWTPNGFVLDAGGGRLSGLVHFLYHAHCWKAGPICYLQDLYVDPESRKTGQGRMLMEAVFRRAREDGAEGTYWMTQDFNAEARKLYDRIGSLTDFIKYEA